MGDERARPPRVVREAIRPHADGDLVHRAGAGRRHAEEADRQRRVHVAPDPVDRADQTTCEQVDVEPALRGDEIALLLGRRQQVEEQRAQAGLVQCGRDPAIARAVAARAAAVGEDHDPARVLRQDEVALERRVRDGDGDLLAFLQALGVPHRAALVQEQHRERRQEQDDAAEHAADRGAEPLEPGNVTDLGV